MPGFFDAIAKSAPEAIKTAIMIKQENKKMELSRLKEAQRRLEWDQTLAESKRKTDATIQEATDKFEQKAAADKIKIQIEMMKAQREDLKMGKDIGGSAGQGFVQSAIDKAPLTGGWGLPPQALTAFGGRSSEYGGAAPIAFPTKPEQAMLKSAATPPKTFEDALLRSAGGDPEKIMQMAKELKPAVNIDLTQKKSDITLNRQKQLEDYKAKKKINAPITLKEKETIRKTVAAVEAEIQSDPKSKDIKAKIEFFNESAKAVGKRYIYLIRKVPRSILGFDWTEEKPQRIELPVKFGAQIYWEDILETSKKNNQTPEEVLIKLDILK